MEKMTNDYGQERENLQKIKDFARMNMANMATVMICVLYFCSAFLTPAHRDDISVWEIFLNSILAFMASMSLNNLYNNKAIMAGLSEPSIVKAADTHNERIDNVTESNAMDDLDAWCKEQNKKNYRNQRVRILSKVGLSYGDCFTEEGFAKEVELVKPKIKMAATWGLRMYMLRRAMVRRQLKAFKKAVQLRLSELSAGELTGEGANGNDPFNLGRGIAEYRKQIAAKNTTSKIVFSFVAGYMAADLIAEFSWLKLMLNTLQILLFLVMASIQYINTSSFMLGEYKERLTKKGRYLLKFLSERAAMPAERSNKNNDEVSRKLGHPDHEGSGDGQTDRELHAVASGNI